MSRFLALLQRSIWRSLTRLDALFNRLYGSRYNPLYQSGSLVIALLATVTVTGLYLLLFYRIGSPYESVAGLTAQVWGGRWMRSLHRYASDAAVVAVAVHALRLFVQGRSWGPRALAWISGVTLLFVLFVCGWTGYVMVWDVQGYVLAAEGARLLDSLPIFAEPISRSFVGDGEIPNAFFFLNLFMHVALPVGMGLLLWIHVSRVARPVLLPPRRMLWAVILLLTVLSIAWPIGMAPAANPFRLPGRAAYDLFFSFWLPISRAVPAPLVWSAFVVIATLSVSIPILTRPRTRPAEHSSVDQPYCTGCEQCYLDCPYEAIEMLERRDGRVGLVARVDPRLCVSCGICAASCAPMRVGPPRRTGRDQLSAVRDFLEIERPGPRDVVLLACDRAVHDAGVIDRLDGATVYSVSCAGSVHTSAIELLIRAGVGGVMIAACPRRDCWNREGAIWLEERLYHDREAELQARVDRDRICLVYAGPAEMKQLRRELGAFQTKVEHLAVGAEESVPDLIRMCEVLEGEAR